MSATSNLSTEQLAKLGRTATLQSVPEQSRQSLPIPVRSAAGMSIAFFFCPSLATPQGVKMAPPDFFVLLDPETGQVRELRKVSPADFRRPDAIGALLGVFRLPEGMTAAQYVEQRSVLFTLYDQLLPEFAHGQEHTSPGKHGQEQVSPGVRSAARNFEALFRLLREPPVDAYYEATGHDFFQWVRDAASEP